MEWLYAVFHDLEISLVSFQASIQIFFDKLIKGYVKAYFFHKLPPVVRYGFNIGKIHA